MPRTLQEYFGPKKEDYENSLLPLHEKRWLEMKARTREQWISQESTSFNYGRTTQSNKNKKSMIFSNDGKNTKIRPFVYKDAYKAIEECKKQFKDQAEHNIKIIKEAMEVKGRRLATKKDLTHVKSQMEEGAGTIKAGLYSIKTMKVIVEWLGYLFYFELVGENIKDKKEKFMGYIVDKASVIYIGKEGNSVSKEIVLKCDLWWTRKFKNTSPDDE